MKQGLFVEWKWQERKDENGRWQWRAEMAMGNKHVNEPLAFICGLWMDKKKWKVDVNVNGKVWSEMRWMVYYEVWTWWMDGCDGWMDVMETIISESFSSVWIWFFISIFSLCCWSSSYETNWSLRETPFSCSHLSFLLKPAKKLILLLQWNVRLSKERGDQSL